MKLSFFVYSADAKEQYAFLIFSRNTAFSGSRGRAGKRETTTQIIRNEVRGDKRISRLVLLSLEKR